MAEGPQSRQTQHRLGSRCQQSLGLDMDWAAVCRQFGLPAGGAHCTAAHCGRAAVPEQPQSLRGQLSHRCDPVLVSCAAMGAV